VQLLAILGQTDAAYALAKRLPAETFGDPVWFGADLARFRADPRFLGLAVQLSIAQTWMQSGLWPDFCTGRVAACRAGVIEALKRS
jgi:hypothetical protein